jgi:hypothetical protein
VAGIAHERTGGIIRVLDNLFESALCLAASNGDTTVTADCIAQVADSQFGLRLLDQQQIDQLLLESDAAQKVPDSRAAGIPTLTEIVSAGMDADDQPEEPADLLLQLRQY